MQGFPYVNYYCCKLSCRKVELVPFKNYCFPKYLKMYSDSTLVNRMKQLVVGTDEINENC